MFDIDLKRCWTGYGVRFFGLFSIWVKASTVSKNNILLNSVLNNFKYFSTLHFLMKKIVVALTGASGQVYGIRILEELNNLNVETHVIVSKPAQLTLEAETDLSVDYLRSLATYFYTPENIGAKIASGSFRHDGMVIAPCSMKTASSIAYGIADNLITRAADVTLKEKRKLILLVRETPLHEGHLDALLRLAKFGALIMPPVPAFYTRPKTIEEIVDQTVLRVIEKLGFDVDYKEWVGIEQ